MTRHKHAQTGLVIPPLPQLLLTAALRMLAMLVLNVASTFRMKARRAPVNATPTTPRDLRQRTTDTQQQETRPAVQHDSPIALILRSAAELRVSKDEGVLTTPSVSLGSRQAIHLPQCSALMEATQRITATKGNLPPPVRSTGGGGLRALARKTEGAAPYARTPNKNAAA